MSALEAPPTSAVTQANGSARCAAEGRTSSPAVVLTAVLLCVARSLHSSAYFPVYVCVRQRLDFTRLKKFPEKLSRLFRVKRDGQAGRMRKHGF